MRLGWECVRVCAPAPVCGGVGFPHLFICSSLFGTQSPRVAVTPALACAQNSLYSRVRVHICSKLAPYKKEQRVSSSDTPATTTTTRHPLPLAATCLSFCLKTIKTKLFIFIWWKHFSYPWFCSSVLCSKVIFLSRFPGIIIWKWRNKFYFFVILNK